MGYQLKDEELRCPQRSLGGSQCTLAIDHLPQDNHAFPAEPDLNLIDAVNWALARDCARMSAELGILHARIIRLEGKLLHYRAVALAQSLTNVVK